MKKRKKKIPKASKKRLLVFGTLSVVIIVYFIAQLLFYTYRIYDLKKTQRNNDEEYNELKADEKELRTEINKLQDADYIARYAREEYSYSKKNEYIIKLNEEKEKKTNEDEFKLNLNIDYLYFIYGGVILSVIFIIIKAKK